MKRRHVLFALLMPALAGCMTLYHKRDVARAGEERLSVNFESEAAATWFQSRLALRNRDREASKQTLFAVPFVTLYHRETVLADNAFFNDQVRACDTNGDGKITEAEARVYACPTPLPPAR